MDLAVSEGRRRNYVFMWYVPIIWGRIRQLSNLNMAIIASDAHLLIHPICRKNSRISYFLPRSSSSSPRGRQSPLGTVATCCHSPPPSPLRLVGAGIGRRYVWCSGGRRRRRMQLEHLAALMPNISPRGTRGMEEGQRRCCCSFPHILFSHVYALCFAENSHCRCMHL